MALSIFSKPAKQSTLDKDALLRLIFITSLRLPLRPSMSNFKNIVFQKNLQRQVSRRPSH